MLKKLRKLVTQAMCLEPARKLPIPSTSFPGSSLFLPRESRKREDPGNEVADPMT